LSVIILVMSLGVADARRADAQEAAGSYRVKAAFLPNFARFVEWPASSFPESDSPLIIGVVGDDPFGGILEGFLRGTLANGHPIQLQRLSWSDSMNGCHVLFISSSEVRHLPAILQGVAGTSVLTISDIERFSLNGGMIELRMVGNRVRFDINLKVADDAHLKVSSKLIGVARAVIAKGKRKQ
jgi:hypothetical protein